MNQSVTTMTTCSVQVALIFGGNFPSIIDALSTVGGAKTKHGARSKSTRSKSAKRTTDSTLAVATTVQQQVREQHKRHHVPTNRFGKFDSDQQVNRTLATNNRDLMYDLTVQDRPSKRSMRTVQPPQGASSTNQTLLFPPGLLFNTQAATQPAAKQAAQSMVPDSNFLIDDNFSNLQCCCRWHSGSPNAESASPAAP